MREQETELQQEVSREVPMSWNKEQTACGGEGGPVKYNAIVKLVGSDTHHPEK